MVLGKTKEFELLEILEEKARLTMSYVRSSMYLYREVRERSRSLLQQAKESGYRQVVLDKLSPCNNTELAKFGIQIGS